MYRLNALFALTKMIYCKYDLQRGDGEDRKRLYLSCWCGISRDYSLQSCATSLCPRSNY